MINIQTLVDNAISANLEEYKTQVKTYYMYKRIAEEKSKTLTKEEMEDIKDFNSYARIRLNIFNAIEETLIRMFPEFEDYINERLIEARIEVK